VSVIFRAALVISCDNSIVIITLTAKMAARLNTIVAIAMLAQETDFHIFVRGVDKYLGGGGAAACFGRGAVATPGKAKENV
jgi:hypothetical protein